MHEKIRDLLRKSSKFRNLREVIQCTCWSCGITSCRSHWVFAMGSNEKPSTNANPENTVVQTDAQDAKNAMEEEKERLKSELAKTAKKAVEDNERKAIKATYSTSPTRSSRCTKSTKIWCKHCSNK